MEEQLEQMTLMTEKLVTRIMEALTAEVQQPVVQQPVVPQPQVVQRLEEPQHQVHLVRPLAAQLVERAEERPVGLSEVSSVDLSEGAPAAPLRVAAETVIRPAGIPPEGDLVNKFLRLIFLCDQPAGNGNQRNHLGSHY